VTGIAPVLVVWYWMFSAIFSADLGASGASGAAVALDFASAEARRCGRRSEGDARQGDAKARGGRAGDEIGGVGGRRPRTRRRLFAARRREGKKKIDREAAPRGVAEHRTTRACVRFGAASFCGIITAGEVIANISKVPGGRRRREGGGRRADVSRSPFPSREPSFKKTRRRGRRTAHRAPRDAGSS
jgi:hypothetical protein